ncbi:MAG: OB-fold domain-containing protein [Alphaproteobacteria bacterium]|nr:OB-fold domain-containing protein [Alphaproteobacteria bacterium]
MTLLKPDLYTDAPALKGGRCAKGHVFFPMQTYGCETCGSTELRPQELKAEGALVASATVHLHNGKGREAPFTIVAVKLAEGPMVRTLLDGPPNDDLAPGTPMKAVLSGEPADLRFAPAR